MGHTNHGDLELAQPAASDGGGFLEELCTAQPHLSPLVLASVLADCVVLCCTSPNHETFRLG